MATSEKNDDGQTVKRVGLPGGKAIEVVYFGGTERKRRGPRRPDELHVCPSCDCDLVYPVHWEEAGTTRWEVSLRCPNCEWIETGVFEQDTVERFDEELDRGTDALVEDLKRLIHANMEEQIERFTAALRQDIILPEDF
jgi:hypothetical protein